MPEAYVGQVVMVDMAGQASGAVSFGAGASARGTIIAINVQTGAITVKLDITFGGQSSVTVPPSKITAVD